MTDRNEFSPTLLLATSNPGKIRELQALLGADVSVRSLMELGVEGPEETGDTFEANAAIKALALSLIAPEIVIADDSGLEIDALSGAPGVRSARYSGEPPDDDRNIDLVLDRLREVPPEFRTARFRCAVAVARDGIILLTGQGVCEGRIGYDRRGRNGFGYDPVFVLPGGLSMAEIETEEKNRVSHRAAAYREVANDLKQLLATSSFSGASST